MKILYDHQVFWLQRYGGISRYFVELMTRLQSVDGVEVSLSLWYSQNQHLQAVKESSRGLVPRKPLLFDTIKWGQEKTKKDLIGFLDHRASYRALKEGDFDIFHPTYYYPYFLDRLLGKPFVLTVYDMTHEMMPHSFKPDDPTPRKKKLLAERASHVIAISESTKRDLVRICQIPSEKVTVVHLASSIDVKVIAPKRPTNLPDRYLLFVGKRGGYKNFDRFLEAVAPILRGDSELHIVCGGGGPLSHQELANIQNNGLSGRVLQFDVDDPTLVALYSNALAFVYPSLYEGFGIPILEAFNCGCPVIAANSSSFPEVVGDAGLLYDPTDSEKMRNSIERVLFDEKLRSSLIAKGYLQAKGFSWERMAEETLAIYRGLV